ncbi:hypothetical protein BGZ89_003343 [Linnemannia elongata]|nr:hypothetical protein BGZ89_003343 [Linnemannia elongata]
MPTSAAATTSKMTKTTINSLPPECIEHILSYLRTNPLALSSLLRTNKLFFTLVVPILYSDPFSLCLPLCTSSSQAKLANVLLDSALENGFFSVKAFLDATRGQCGSLDCQGQCGRGARLQAFMDQDQDQNPEQWKTIDEELELGLPSSPADELSPQMMPERRRTTTRYIDYLTNYDGQDWISFATTCLSRKSQRHLNMKLLIWMQIRIVDHTAERLTTMVLSPGIVRDLIPMAHRLRSLIRLQLENRFDSDELGYVSTFLSSRQRDIGASDQQDQDEEDDEDEGRGAREKTTRKRRTVAVRGIQEFTLPLVFHSSSSSHHQVANNDQLARQIQNQQLDILHSLTQLVVLDANHCSNFMKIAHQIPCHLLKRLETLKFARGSLEGNAELFLRRCRALRYLDFASFHTDVFSWAVLEKQQRLQQQQKPQKSQTLLQPTTTTPTVTATATSPATPQPFSADLVQLRKLRLATSQWYIGRSMQSIAFAFSHSLEDLLLNVYEHELLRTVLCAHAVVRLEASQTRDIPFRIDSFTFIMPRLKKLRLLRVNESIVVGPAPFEGCPLLEDLSISGRIGFLAGSARRFEILRIPLLKALEFGTGVASAYQIGSLQYSPLLETLVLVDPLPATFPPPPSGDGEGFCDIFSSTKRPLGFTLCWTWRLRHLTKMHLAGLPAFYFRFEWIRRCPSLKTLTVDGLLPSTYLHHPDPAEPQDHFSQGLEDSVYDDSTCGKYLHNCELIIYSRNRQLDRSGSALARVLETYCPNVTRLKLTGRANPHPEEYPAAAPTTTATMTTGQQESWEHIDLGTALLASKNLPNLTLLVSRIGSGPCLHTLTEQYNLVRGTNVVQKTSSPARQGQAGVGTVVAVWCRNIPFKDLQIELEDLGGGGCTRFRQHRVPATP